MLNVYVEKQTSHGIYILFLLYIEFHLIISKIEYSKYLISENGNYKNYTNGVQLKTKKMMH